MSDMNRVTHAGAQVLQRGLSLVELMVAMALSGLLGIAVVTVFVNNSYSFNLDESVARMQDDARYALREIAYDISMAGHYADLHIPSLATHDANLAIGTDCGPAAAVNWMYDTVDGGTGDPLSITAVDNATSASLIAAHDCFVAADLQPGTDVVSIKRVAGNNSAALTAGSVYLRTNGTVGLLYRAPFPATPTLAVPAPQQDWEYRPSIYFIRPYANVVGDGIPTLCRKRLQGAAPSMATECLATGIENLQIEYGIDSSGDGHPNAYITNPTVADMQNAVAAKIFILARTTDLDTRYTNGKTYSISNAADFTPNDSFHRRVFTTSVAIQNVRSMTMMAF